MIHQISLPIWLPLMSEAVKEVTSALKDIFINPVKEAVIFRAKNNFFGSLVITWIAWNWEKIAFLFMSNMYIAERIDYIKNHFPSPSENHWWIFPYSYSVVWPVVIATAFTLLYPHFMHTLAIIHKSILDKIEVFNIDKEEESLDRKKKVINLAESIEIEKLKVRAEKNREMEEDNERAARAKKNTQELNATYYELTESVNKLSQDRTNLELNLEHQATRMQQATDELAKLNEKLGPESEREIIIDSLTKRIIDQESMIKELEIKNETTFNEALILKTKLTQKINEAKNLQLMQDEVDSYVNQNKDKIKMLFDIIERSQLNTPMSMRFNFEHTKSSLLNFANNIPQGGTAKNETDLHAESGNQAE